ncbi:flippase-like domain-containing protein [bacterium]|nr:flippase-like domain-containing protein [bacterium]
MMTVIKAVIGAVVLFLLAYTVDISEIVAAYRHPHTPAYMYIGVLLVVPNLLLQWYRWHFLLTLQHPGVPPADSLVSLFGGMMLGFATPGRIGEAGRALFLPRGDRVELVGLVVIDKLYSFFPIIIGGAWGLAVLFARKFLFSFYVAAPLYILAGSLTLFFLFAAASPDTVRTFFYSVSLLFPHRENMKRLIAAFDRLTKKDGIQLLVLSVILYAVFMLQFALFARAFYPISAEAGFSCTTAAMLVKTLLPVSLADLGIREGASVFFFMQYSVDKVAAFNSALLLFTVNVLFPSILGVGALPKMTLPPRPHVKSVR